MDTKRSKNSRQRGSKTHGWGSMKKHRGAGHRGGRGAAGSGKRGDAKKPSIWRNTEYAGKKGFTSHSTTTENPIALVYLENHAKTLIAKGIITVTGNQYTADLTKAGYTKLLGTGNAHKQWNIVVAQATPRAIAKIEAAKGKVITKDTPEVKKSAPEEDTKTAEAVEE